ncbi:N-acylneuraminate cytidylyltransferase isoform X2 [Photinus pyralis]|uniref:N-acylneuraminate cytidylyltransferase isoform X2 n=1 Tax=Photinus pyralis TaxID=7054 RepID=UPI001267006B|nr:N-acylneuraminate cytidylyltransferase isoform X2 [Photinus pyralis]
MAHKELNSTRVIDRTATFHSIMYVWCFSVLFATASGCIHTKCNDKHLAVLILARGGSKAIPLKNLAKVGDKSLLSRSLQVILEVAAFDSVWVSTDNFAIYEEAIKNDVNVHWRSAKSATDEAPSILAVQEFLIDHPYIDAVALVQCTSPFLKGTYLQQAAMLLSGSDCVFSVTRSHNLRWKTIEGELVPLNFDPKRRPRRQDFGEFVENGMFYFSTRRLIEKGYLQNLR